MSLESLQEQIENEREWREAEIRILENTQRGVELTTERMTIRRSIVCLIYAHIEGFVKFSFSVYIDEINKQNLLCREVKPVIAAATLHREFIALANKDKKSKLFKRSLPNEAHLHKLSRQVEFIENITALESHKVKVPEDYINTEDNIGKENLEKLLFQIGLENSDLKSVYAPLNKLKNVRNDIAHGKRKSGIDDIDYAEFVNCCKSIIQTISRRITMAFARKEYLISTAASSRK